MDTSNPDVEGPSLTYDASFFSPLVVVMREHASPACNHPDLSIHHRVSGLSLRQRTTSRIKPVIDDEAGSYDRSSHLVVVHIIVRMAQYSARVLVFDGAFAAHLLAIGERASEAFVGMENVSTVHGGAAHVLVCCQIRVSNPTAPPRLEIWCEGHQFLYAHPLKVSALQGQILMSIAVGDWLQRKLAEFVL
jgi:hypothetical protein